MEYAILFLPLLGSIVGYLGKSLTKYFSEIITSLLVAFCSLINLSFLERFQMNYGNYKIFEWISSGNFTANWSINIDPLSSVMLVVVTFVSALVHLFNWVYESRST